MDVRQVVAICAHGAHFLRNGGRAPELLTTHSTFRTVHALEFRRPSVLQASLISESVGPLLRRFVTEGVVSIRPIINACGTSLDGDTGAWGVLTDGDRGMELWRPTWRARLAGHDDPKPHRVVYNSERASRWHLPPVPDIAVAGATLMMAVTKAVDIMRDEGKMEQAFPLIRCMDLHREGSTDIGASPDLFPTEGDMAGRILGTAAFRAALIAANGVNGEHRELYRAIWTASMAAFESAVPSLTAVRAA